MNRTTEDTATDAEVLLEEALALFPDEVDAWEAIHQAAPDQRIGLLRTLLHRRQDADAPTALCLSGGGIRSATFSLGVVQGLAARGLLTRFHYLSSVSGGGYLASWLSAWIRNEALRSRGTAQAEETAAGSSRKAPEKLTLDDYNAGKDRVFQTLGKVGHACPEEPAPLRKLRAYSSYLSPMRGISADALTLLAIYFRNLVLNWMVLIPALLAVLLLPRLHMAMLHAPAPKGCWTYGAALVALLLIAWTIAYMASDLPAAPGSESPQGDRLSRPPPERPRPVLIPLVLPLVVAAILISWLIAWQAGGFDPLPVLRVWLIPAPGPAIAAEPRWQGVLAAALAGGVVHALSSAAGGMWLRKLRGVESGTRPATLGALMAVTVTGCLTGVGLFYLVQALVAISSGAGNDMRLLALWGVPLLLLLFWFGVTLYTGWRRPMGHEDEREWWARAAARWCGASLLWLAAFALVLYLPGALLSWSVLKGVNTGALGAGTGLLGVLVAVAGYLSKHGPAWRQRAETIAEKTGLRVLDLAAISFILLLLCGLSFGATMALRADPKLQERQDANFAQEVLEPARKKATCAAAQARTKEAGTLPTTCIAEPCPSGDCAHWTDKGTHHYEQSLVETPPLPLLAAFASLLGLALLVSNRIGVNAFSLHSMYGNRLVRAYLAASRKHEERRPHWFTGFDPKDNVPMNELWPAGGTPDDHSPLAETAAQSPPRLLHVVNIALNLVQPSGKRLEWQDRKAAAFTVSPLFSGSPITDYVRSAAYIESPHRQGISLGAAMTISGAAASPNMGYHSSLPLAFVMTLFNVRLGLWMPNPCWPALSGERSRWPWRRDEPALGLNALLDEALGNTSAESRFLSLSDGGHFDNMGLYEMVRRRCRRIVLVDATADPDYQFDDLLSTLRKIRVDMGIAIEFSGGLPGPTDKGRTGCAVSVGTIHYASADTDGRAGAIVLIKPALLPEVARPIQLAEPHAAGTGPVTAAVPADQPFAGQLPLDVRRYAEESARGKDRFPQQPTSDQFFDEAQFESYRMLGLHLTLTAFADGSLSPIAPGPGAGPSHHGPSQGPPPAGGPTSANADSRSGKAGEFADAIKAGSPVASTLPAAGMLSQIKDSIGLIGATALVSAITVTGAVKLSDATVRISNPEVKIVAAGVSDPTPVPPVDPVPPGQLDLSRLQQGLDAAGEAASGVALTAMDARTSVVDMGQRASEAASELKGLVDSLRGRPGQPGRLVIQTVDAKLLQSIATNAEQAATRAGDAASASSLAATQAARAASSSVDANLYLRDIRNVIVQTPPRANPRSVGSGER